MHAHHHGTIDPASFISFLIFGLMTSVHCVGMCTPISALFLRKGESGGVLRPLMLYHGSRLLGYIAIGMLLAKLGSAWVPTGLRQYVTYFVIALLLLTILYPKLWEQRWFLGLQRGFMRLIAMILGPRAIPAGIGLATSLFPCGMLYVAYAACTLTTSAMAAVVGMAAFFAGTVPLLALAQLGVSRVQNIVPPRWNIWIYRGLGLVGIFFLVRASLR